MFFETVGLLLAGNGGFHMVNTFSNTLLKLAQRIAPLPELYLDTNVWIDLAKGKLTLDPVVEWVTENKGYVGLAKYQLTELSKSPQLVESLANVLSQLKIVMVERWYQEIRGDSRGTIIQDPDNFMELTLSKPEHFDVFVDEMLNGPIVQSQSTLEEDGRKFQKGLATALTQAHKSVKPSWSSLGRFVEQTVSQRVPASGGKLHSEAFTDESRYAGIKLQYAIAFVRYYLHGKKWEPSDYLDFLHCSDIAYAHTVVTERSLAEQLGQIKTRVPAICPEAIETIRSFFD